MRILQRFVKGVDIHYADMLDVVHCPELCLHVCLLSKNVKIRIHKTILLLLVSYGCETWPLTLRGNTD
jgi:hypothetical protein